MPILNFTIVIISGKSNVITGVAKSIKQHFEKHPLAIVNIKGRAKGTSAREVIYNLEVRTLWFKSFMNSLRW